MNVLKLVFGPIAEIVGSAWKDHRDLKRAKVDGEIEFLKSEQGHRHAWEIASINNTGKGLRWASFMLWSTPMVYGWFYPERAAERLQALLGAFPDWYVVAWLTMIGGIWGAKELATLAGLRKSRGK